MSSNAEKLRTLWKHCRRAFSSPNALFTASAVRETGVEDHEFDGHTQESKLKLALAVISLCRREVERLEREYERATSSLVTQTPPSNDVKVPQSDVCLVSTGARNYFSHLFLESQLPRVLFSTSLQLLDANDAYMSIVHHIDASLLATASGWSRSLLLQNLNSKLRIVEEKLYSEEKLRMLQRAFAGEVVETVSLRPSVQTFADGRCVHLRISVSLVWCTFENNASGEQVPTLINVLKPVDCSVCHALPLACRPSTKALFWVSDSNVGRLVKQMVEVSADNPTLAGALIDSIDPFFPDPMLQSFKALFEPLVADSASLGLDEHSRFANNTPPDAFGSTAPSNTNTIACPDPLPVNQSLSVDVIPSVLQAAGVEPSDSDFYSTESVSCSPPSISRSHSVSIDPETSALQEVNETFDGDSFDIVPRDVPLNVSDVDFHVRFACFPTSDIDDAITEERYGNY